MMDNKGYIDVQSALKLKEAEGRAVVAGLITLVVTSLSTILRGIVENGDNKEALLKEGAKRGLDK